MPNAKAITALGLVILLAAPAVAARGNGRVGSLRLLPAAGGQAVAGIGDLDGDGVPDLAVGDPDHDAVTIHFMAPDGTAVATQAIGSAMGGFVGGIAGSEFGEAVGPAGDVDGDGVGDLVVGAPDDDDLWEDTGAVWIIFLRADGTVKGQQKISSLSGGLPWLPPYAYFGWSVAGLGDVDGDGTPDLAVGAPYVATTSSRNGSVFVLLLRPDGTVRSTARIDDLHGGFVGTLPDYELFGISLAGLGDLDGDGTPDLVVGAEHDPDGRPFTGALWILTLTPSGGVATQQKISARTGGLTAALTRGKHFGTDVAAVGDVDGDGVTDLVALQYSHENRLDGAAWVLFLRADGTVKSFQQIDDTYGGLAVPPGGRFGHGVSVGAPGDLDGDGIVDLAVGVPGGATPVWVLFGDGFAKPPCDPSPRAVCDAATKASLQLKAHPRDDAQDRLKLKWQGVAAPLLGDPATTTTYALCLYDRVASVPVHVATLRIAPGSGWQAPAPTTLRYLDRTLASDGARTLGIDVAAGGVVRAALVARGLRVPMPVGRADAGFFAMEPGVVAQLVNDAGACWGAEFTAAKSTATRLSARVP